MKKAKHFHQRSVKAGGGYGKIQTVTVCGKQEKMSRLTLQDRIVIECGIYEKLKLSEIAKKIGKSPESISREIRANRTIAPDRCHLPRGRPGTAGGTAEDGGEWHHASPLPDPDGPGERGHHQPPRSRNEAQEAGTG